MIFVSYAREDGVFLDELERELSLEGLPFLRDISLVENNPFWRNIIADHLQQCSVMIILSSKYSRSSPWVEQETRNFDKLKIIIPLDDSSPACFTTSNLGQTKVISRHILIQELKQIIPPKYIFSHASLEEDIVYRQRKKRTFAERENLSRFIRKMVKDQKHLDIYGDFAINSVDKLTFGRLPMQENQKTVYLSTKPVTNALYRTFVNATGFAPPPTWQREAFTHPDAPVVGVNWFEASAYAAWVGGSLPTEEEWECGAQNYDKGLKYATQSGNINFSLAYYSKNFGFDYPVPSSRFPPNQKGFFGMCGNTWDWCSSKWDHHYVIRGGGYMDSENFCKVQTRYKYSPIDRDCCIGFRIKILA